MARLFIFSIPNPDGSFKGNHSLVAFNYFEESNNIKYLILYDNNYPGMATSLKFDLNNNVISYPVYRDNNHNIYNLLTDMPYYDLNDVKKF